MNNNETVGKLSAYCKSKNITIYRLAQLSGINETQLRNIDKTDEYNVTFETAKKIYEGTKSEFGKGLKPQMYLSLDKYSWLK